MINQKDILAALQNGQDPEVLAQNFANALNAAIAEKAAADKKASQNQEKEARMEAMLNQLVDFLQDFYPEIYDDELRNHIPAAEIIKAMDEARDEVIKMAPVLDDLAKLVKTLEKECGVAPTEKVTPKMDPIEAFLKSNGLKM